MILLPLLSYADSFCGVMQRLSNELKSRKMSEARAKAEEQKLRMEQQKRRQTAEEKVRH